MRQFLPRFGHSLVFLCVLGIWGSRQLDSADLMIRAEVRSVSFPRGWEFWMIITRQTETTSNRQESGGLTTRVHKQKGKHAADQEKGLLQHFSLYGALSKFSKTINK